MSITQERMLALINAAKEYRLAREQIIHAADKILSAIAAGETSPHNATIAFTQIVLGSRVSEQSVATLVREETHYHNRKGDNDRRRIKQSIRRFEKRTGAPPQRGIASERIYDESMVAPGPSHKHSEKNRGIMSTAPEHTPFPRKRDRALPEESYEGFGEADLEIAQAQHREEDWKRQRAEWEQIARGERSSAPQGESVRTPITPPGRATPEPGAFRADEGLDPNEEDF